MKRILLAALLAPFLLAAPRGSAVPGKLEQPRQLTIRIYNYGDVEAAAIRRARRGSDRIFAQLGAQTDWLDCHGSNGVMSFPWTKRTLVKMERGLLYFTPAERTKMQQEWDRRSAASRSPHD